jgi:predicted AAA+ superfamily ATPase
MYDRIISRPLTGKKSFFLFGPRGTGKTTWLKKNCPDSLYLDLLDSFLYTDLLAQPGRLENLIPPDYSNWTILDEIQKIPMLLNEVHRLIEKKRYKFILTCSSARSLRRKGVNLLAGRAIT